VNAYLLVFPQRIAALFLHYRDDYEPDSRYILQIPLLVVIYQYIDRVTSVDRDSFEYEPMKQIAVICRLNLTECSTCLVLSQMLCIRVQGESNCNCTISYGAGHLVPDSSLLLDSRQFGPDDTNFIGREAQLYLS
jgi:hypothetical protein